MKNTSAKLTARLINSGYGLKNGLFTFVMLAFKYIFLLSAVFCAVTLYAFVYSDFSGGGTVADAMYYALFSLGIAFSLCFYVLSSYTLKSEYIKTSVSDSDFEFFKFISLDIQLKIIYLHFLRFFRNIFLTAFYLSPAAATAVVTLYFLKDGIDRLIFPAVILLFAILLFSGIYFSFVSMQRLAFIDETVFLNPGLSISQTLKKARQSTCGKCFSLAKFKLSFAIWFLLCIFIIPVFFVVPYYLRCISLYAKQAFGVKAPKPVTEKPVILMKPVKNTV